jgi:hypothetical protein
MLSRRPLESRWPHNFPLLLLVERRTLRRSKRLRSDLCDIACHVEVDGEMQDQPLDEHGDPAPPLFNPAIGAILPQYADRCPSIGHPRHTDASTALRACEEPGVTLSLGTKRSRARRPWAEPRVGLVDAGGASMRGGNSVATQRPQTAGKRRARLSIKTSRFAGETESRYKPTQAGQLPRNENEGVRVRLRIASEKTMCDQLIAESRRHWDDTF